MSQTYESKEYQRLRTSQKRFGHLNFGHLNLFRISGFEFRISPSLINGLAVTFLMTLHFADLGYRSYETGH